MVAPAILPPGLALSYAGAWPGDPEWDECESVELGYATDAERTLYSGEAKPSMDEIDALYEDLDYLSISVLALSCSTELDDTPFDAELAGFPARGGTGYWEVQVGGAAVFVNTSYDDDLIAPL